jgi:tetratricopeptide (TPR) repeat protein
LHVESIRMRESNSRRRKILFKTISILLPLLTLILIEISLRLFHYGNDPNLFIEAPNNPDYLVLNPAASRKYFVDPSFAPTGNSELFRKNKDSSILRIFVLGESTTIGYPYFHNGSFHRWLQYRLMHAFPDRQFEIINLSLTAVNSYTVLGFAKELIRYKPDAVLIYSGQNEYYGTLGVGSSSQVGNNAQIVGLMLYMRQFRFVQLLTNVYEKLKSLGRSGVKYSGQTLMQRMVANQQIVFGSKLFYKGVEQFVSNMNETLDIFNRNHIPVFISNLVCNEKDLTPFVSVAADSIRFPGFNKNYMLGRVAYDNGDWSSADQYFKIANKIYTAHALCNFYLGKLAEKLGDHSMAKYYLMKARDLDGLRFRAPSIINDTISKICSKYPFAHLVDTKSVFEEYSADHIIGNDLMLEHVHPNLTGYAIMSDVFYEALKGQHIITPVKANEMTLQDLIGTMPVTMVDSLTGLYRISRLKASWPFSAALKRDDSLHFDTEEEQLADSVAFQNMKWPYAMDVLYNYYFNRNDFIKAITVTETLVLEHPTDLYFYDQTANLYGKLGDYGEAAFYFRKAFSISPKFEYARKLFVIYLKIDRPADAMPFLEYAINNNTSNLNFLPVRKYAGQIINLQKEIAKDSSNLSVLNVIAETYMTMGNREGAAIYVQKILKMDPKNKTALGLSEQIKKSQG